MWTKVLKMNVVSEVHIFSLTIRQVAQQAEAQGETGWLTPPGDAKALAKTIDAVLAKSEVDRKKLAERAKSNIQDNFSNESMCERTLDVYNDVLSLKPSGVGKPLTPGSS